MSDLVEVLRFLTLFCAGIAVGGWVLVHLAVGPTKRAMAPGPAVQLHQVTTKIIDHYMPANVALAILAGVLVLILEPNRTTMSTVFTAVGVVSFLVSGIVSIVWNFPTNRLIEKWSIDAVPEEYRAIQQRWDNTHAIRTLLGLIGITGYIIGALAR